MQQQNNNPISRKWLAAVACLGLFLAGIVIGSLWTRLLLPDEPESILFAEQDIPAIMSNPLGREGAHEHRIGRWSALTSLTAGNDSLALKYNDTYVTAFYVDRTRKVESIVINHPLHDAVSLILDNLNISDSSGKLTVDILTAEGDKVGFVVDENMDGQPNLRFEYGGPHLYVWLDDAWHRVMRTSPQSAQEGFTHSVMYRGQLHRISMQEFPYQLDPLQPH